MFLLEKTYKYYILVSAQYKCRGEKMDGREKKKIYTVPEIYMNGTDGGDFRLSLPEEEKSRQTAVFGENKEN